MGISLTSILRNTESKDLLCKEAKCLVHVVHVSEEHDRLVYLAQHYDREQGVRVV